ncbi:MAG: MarR family transcriptional regulator [Flavobacteriales bacterium]|nr:MarR family transcriptional regulator [Flavobacteriales bacterium]
MKIEQELQTGKFRNEQHKASLNIMFTAYVLHRSVAAALKPFGITPEQYNVLRILNGKRADKLCVKDIAGRMIERSSNVPRILDRLENKALVSRERSPEDGRESLIGITPKGIELVENMTEAVEKNAHVLALTDSEAWTLNELLDKSRG